MTGQRSYPYPGASACPGASERPSVTAAHYSVIIEPAGAKRRVARASEAGGARVSARKDSTERCRNGMGRRRAPGGSGGGTYGDPPTPPHAGCSRAFQLCAGGEAVLHQPAEHRPFRQGARERARHRAVRAAGQRDGAHARGAAAGWRGGRDRGEGGRLARGLRQSRCARRGAEPCGEHQPVCGDTAEYQRVHRAACRSAEDSRDELRGLLSVGMLWTVGTSPSSCAWDAGFPTATCSR